MVNSSRFRFELKKNGLCFQMCVMSSVFEGPVYVVKDNIDTDQIIPARFLRRGKDDPEYPRFLFHDLRFNEDGSEKDFVYNKAPYCEGRILVTDVNWGCGSSREFWAFQCRKC